MKWYKWLLIVVFLFLSCSGQKEANAPKSEKKGHNRRVLSVRTSFPIRGSIDQRLSFTGELAADETVEAAASIGGAVKTIAVKMGDSVKKGDLLAAIDDSQLRVQLAEARASLAVARASVTRTELMKKNAKLDLSRKETLLEKKLVTASEMDSLKTKYATQAATLTLTQAEVDKAQARVRLLTTQVQEARIIAPFSGIVSHRYIDSGTVVSAGTPIVQIINVEPVLVKFQVPERFMGTLIEYREKEDLMIQVHLDAFPDTVFKGKIVRIAPALDKITRSVLVEATLADSANRAVPGMYCRIDMDFGRRENVLLVHGQALQDDKSNAMASQKSEHLNKSSVYVVKEERAHKRIVSTGIRRQDGYYEILEGLSDDDEVVIDGANLLQEGSMVNVLEGPSKKELKKPQEKIEP